MIYTGNTQKNGAVSIGITIETAPLFCVCSVYRTLMILITILCIKVNIGFMLHYMCDMFHDSICRSYPLLHIFVIFIAVSRGSYIFCEVTDCINPTTHISHSDGTHFEFYMFEKPSWINRGHHCPFYRNRSGFWKL